MRDRRITYSSRTTACSGRGRWSSPGEVVGAGGRPDLRIRPIHHRAEQRVRAHIFLCLLAYYVEWHMRQALAPLWFDDESLPIERARRDPVAPAQPSEWAKKKKAVRLTADGLPIHSFKTLIAE